MDLQGNLIITNIPNKDNINICEPYIKINNSH